jgi:hypothetical protein
VPKVRRPCPRGLYDGCPIPRELCTEDHEKTGQWHCLKFLKDLEFFVFGNADQDDVREPIQENYQETEVTTLEDLLKVLEGEE